MGLPEGVALHFSFNLSEAMTMKVIPRFPLLIFVGITLIFLGPGCQQAPDRKARLAMNEIGWPVVPAGRYLPHGDIGPAAAALRMRLWLGGWLDSTEGNSTRKFNPSLTNAVRRFQYGIYRYRGISEFPSRYLRLRLTSGGDYVGQIR
jgi:hypothetical protein